MAQNGNSSSVESDCNTPSQTLIFAEFLLAFFLHLILLTRIAVFLIQNASKLCCLTKELYGSTLILLVNWPLCALLLLPYEMFALGRILIPATETGSSSL